MDLTEPSKAESSDVLSNDLTQAIYDQLQMSGNNSTTDTSGAASGHENHKVNSCKHKTTCNPSCAPMVEYTCKRCPGTFSKTQLAIHYNEFHPDQDEEMQRQINLSESKASRYNFRRSSRTKGRAVCSNGLCNPNDGHSVKSRNSNGNAHSAAAADEPLNTTNGIEPTANSCNRKRCIPNQTSQKREYQLPARYTFPLEESHQEQEITSRTPQSCDGENSDVAESAGNALTVAEQDDSDQMFTGTKYEVHNRDNEYHVKGDHVQYVATQYKFSGPVTLHAGADSLENGLMEFDEGTTIMTNNKTQDEEAGGRPSKYIKVPTDDVANTGIPPFKYNKLLLAVGDKLTPKQFKGMKTLLREDPRGTNYGIRRSVIERIKDTSELLDCMEYYKYLSPSNMWLLQYLLYSVGNKALYKRVFDFTTECLTSSDALFMYSPSDIPQGTQMSKVKLKVTGDINQFQEITVKEYQALLAQQCGADIEYVSEIGREEGCIILYFQVPSICKAALLHFNPETIKWYQENGIILVCFDGDVILELPKGEDTIPSKVAELGNMIVDILENKLDNVRQYSSFKADLKIGGKSLLHLATESNHQEVVEHLLSHRAKLDEVDQMGATPFHMAVFLGLIHICRMFLKHPDVDINAIDKYGNTALHIAVCQRDFHQCALLIKHGASTDIKNQDGKTSLDLAKENNITCLLLLTGEAKAEDLMVAVGDEHVLSCPICWCSFKEPRILPCGHNFCGNCLEVLWKTSFPNSEYLLCPMCKRQTDVKGGDIRTFMLNVPLLEQIEEARYVQIWEGQQMEEEEEEEKEEEQPQISEENEQQTPEDSVSDCSVVVDDEISFHFRRMDIGDEAGSKTKGIPASRAPCLTKVTQHSLICQLCHKNFKAPVRKLGCSHSFCGCCLETVAVPLIPIAYQSHLKCPTCDEVTVIPPNGVSDLIQDRNLDGQVDDANLHDSAQNYIDAVVDEEREDWELQESSDTNELCAGCQHIARKPMYLPCGHGCCENCIERVQCAEEQHGDWQIICSFCKNEYSADDVNEKEGKEQMKDIPIDIGVPSAEYQVETTNLGEMSDMAPKPSGDTCNQTFNFGKEVLKARQEGHGGWNSKMADHNGINPVWVIADKPSDKDHSQGPSQEEYEHDVYLACSTEDTSWGLKLLNILEDSPQKCRTYLHDRDCILGRSMIDDRANQIENSFKFICLISPSFFRSGLCKQDLQLAQHEQRVNRPFSNFVIPLQIAPCNIPVALRNLQHCEAWTEGPSKCVVNMVLRAFRDST